MIRPETLKIILESNDLESIEATFPHRTKISVNGITTYEMIKYFKYNSMDALQLVERICPESSNYNSIDALQLVERICPESPNYNLIDALQLVERICPESPNYDPLIKLNHQKIVNTLTMELMRILQSITDPDLRFCKPKFIEKYLLWNRNVNRMNIHGGCYNFKWITIINLLEKTKTRLKIVDVTFNQYMPHGHIIGYLRSDLAGDLVNLCISAVPTIININDEHKIFNGFHNRVSLTRLELKHHSMDKNTSLSLARLLGGSTSIKTLILNELHIDDFKPIFRTIGKNNTLVHFHLESVQLTMSEGGTMKYALSESKSITVFRCEKMTMRDDTLDVVYGGLLSDNYTRFYFGLADNDMLSSFGDTKCNLRDLISKNITIKTLDLSSCKIDDDALIDISKGLIENKTLENLVLSDEKFGAFGLEPFCAVLIKYNTTLKSLDLSYNRLGRNSLTTMPLLTYFEGNGALESLDLSGNEFNGDSLIQLMIHLGSDTTLSTLRLRDSDITSADLYSIERVVAHLNITHMDIECELTDRVNMINLKLSRNGEFANSTFLPPSILTKNDSNNADEYHQPRSTSNHKLT